MVFRKRGRAHSIWWYLGWFWIFSLGAVKLVLAWHLSLFGDEAFYWLEAKHLAFGYSDLPPLTAWLIALSTGIVGDTYFGVRWLLLIFGCALPIGVYGLAREFYAPPVAMRAAMLSTALPLVASMGVLALPDVPLNAVAMVFLIALLRALDRGGWWWLLTGALAALGLLCHFRFALPLAGAVVFFLSTASERRRMRTPGPWVAGAVALLGALPTLWFNWQTGGLSLLFQLRDRHPWHWQPEGLLQPVVQALVTTPMLYVALFIAAARVWRLGRRSPRWALLAWVGILPPAVYFALGLWADQERSHFHWPLLGYLVLCVALPDAIVALRGWLVARWGRVVGHSLVASGISMGFAASVALLGLLSSAVLRPQWQASLGDFFPDNISAWRAVAAATSMYQRPGDALIADNFMLAAELSFETGQSVMSLDHPLNHRHGRAGQMAIWGLDETALQSPPWDRAVLVVEETALDFAQRPAWVRRLCQRFDQVRILGELTSHGHERFLFYAVTPGSGAVGETACDRPAFAYLDAPRRDAKVRGTTLVSGWAFEDDRGVERVEILVDGVPAGNASYGRAYPAVLEFFPDSSDPNHPYVGFELLFDTRPWPNGAHVLVVRTVAKDGGVRETRAVDIEIVNP